MFEWFWSSTTFYASATTIHQPALMASASGLLIGRLAHAAGRFKEKRKLKLRSMIKTFCSPVTPACQGLITPEYVIAASCIVIAYLDKYDSDTMYSIPVLLSRFIRTVSLGANTRAVPFYKRVETAIKHMESVVSICEKMTIKGPMNDIELHVELMGHCNRALRLSYMDADMIFPTMGAFSHMTELCNRAEPLPVAEVEEALRVGLTAASQVYQLYVVSITLGLLAPDKGATLQDMVDVVHCFVVPVVAMYLGAGYSILTMRAAVERGEFDPHEPLNDVLIGFTTLHEFVTHFSAAGSLPQPSADRDPHYTKLVMVSMRHRCAACGASEELASKLCNGCKKVHYCGVRCQKSHWTKHKLVCGK